MIRVLHIADVHLGAPFHYLGERAAERRDDIEKSFIRAMEIARDPAQRIDAVLIAGDLFESHQPATRLVELVKEQIRLVKQAGAETVIVPGTHDSSSYLSTIYREEVFPGAILLTTPNISEPRSMTIRGIPVSFYGLAWDPRKSVKPYDVFKRRDTPGLHIALIHGTIVEKTPGDINSISPDHVPLRLEQLKQSGMHYIALGHFHNFDTFADNRIVYPGTLEAFNVTEPGDRYCIIAEISESGVTLHKEKTNRRTFLDISLELTQFETVEHIKQHVQKIAQNDGENILVRLRLSGCSPDINIASMLRDTFSNTFFYLDIIDDSDILHSSKVMNIAAEPGVRGEFVRLLMDTIKTANTPEEKSLHELALKIGLTALLKNDH